MILLAIKNEASRLYGLTSKFALAVACTFLWNSGNAQVNWAHNTVESPFPNPRQEMGVLSGVYTIGIFDVSTAKIEYNGIDPILVGIGLDAPVEMLHVNSFIRSNDLGLAFSTGSLLNTDGIVISDQNGKLFTRIKFTGSSSDVLLGDGTFGASPGSGSDNDWYDVGNPGNPPALNTDDIYTFGNVGLGTNSPLAALDVRGTGGTTFYAKPLTADPMELLSSGRLSIPNNLDFKMGTGGSNALNYTRPSFTIQGPYAGNSFFNINSGRFIFGLLSSGYSNPTYSRTYFSSPYLALTSSAHYGFQSINSSGWIQSNFVEALGMDLIDNTVGNVSTYIKSVDNGTNVIRIYANYDGKVGIGTTAPTMTLSVNGDANKIGGGTWAIFSDARLKENISDYSEGLDFLMKVRTVNYSYNDKMKEIWGESTVDENKIYQGVIAQELQEIAPDMVRSVQVTPSGSDSKSSESFLEVDPNKFTYALINAVKEQQVIINSQTERIEVLEQKMDELISSIESNSHNNSPKKDMFQDEKGNVLHQNRPNPFDNSTVISYDLAEQGKVVLNIYTTDGDQIVTLIDEDKEPGNYSIEWETSGVPAGTYVYVLTLNDSELFRKAVRLD